MVVVVEAAGCGASSSASSDIFGAREPWASTRQCDDLIMDE